MSTKKGFYAYPSEPSNIGQVIESCSKISTQSGSGLIVNTWKALDIVGHFISDQVLAEIDQADVIIADISKLNFNVTYEIGYAIGKSKKLLLTKNKSLVFDDIKINDVGIFDTIGYLEYENSSELLSNLRQLNNSNAINNSSPINLKSPVYILETQHKTDWSGRIISRIKKSRYIFRSFDPNESPRLSAYDAISQVSQSYGVVVPLLSDNSSGFKIHNIRAAFVAGLAEGMEKPLCIIQDGDSPVPIDYKDFVNITYHPSDVDEVIAEFVGEVATRFQQFEPTLVEQKRGFLKDLNLGSSSAENEMRDLSNYYLETDQYLKSLRGESHIVVGRKGSGKSAIFLQVRDREREINRNKNIVLDLKPDGYKLVKFKEQILSFLEEGTYQHTITAFWEYVLLLEVCYKILEKDVKRHIHDHLLFDVYRRLSVAYRAEEFDTEGDFSERMSKLMESIYSEYQAKYGSHHNTRLSTQEVTELLYSHDIKELRKHLNEYMKHKGVLWLLFDNIDKGWPASGLKHEDLLIISALVDACRKIEREFGRHDLLVNTIIFLRNDVYELLIKETSDRGKEESVILDWTDDELLREIMRLRIVSNNLEEDMDFKTAWSKVCVSHYHGVESSQYLIDRSLMRPRFLLSLINQCKSFAINLNHNRIEEDDITKGVESFSTDLLRDIGYELIDVSGVPDDILYSFISCNSELSESEVKELMIEFGLDKSLSDNIFKLLLWYGFIGIKVSEEDTKYIYNFNYKIALMEGFIKKNNGLILYIINPAFWPSLMINT